MRRKVGVAIPWLGSALLACGVGALLACSGGEEEVQIEAQPVSITLVRSVDLVERIEATGQLVAKERAQIAAEVGGRITEVLIDEGSPAEENATVLSIDPERRTLERDSARARVDEARAEVRDRERDFARAKELRQRKVASQDQLDQAQTELSLARSRLLASEAEFGVLRRALDDANVGAPFSGMIAQRFVSRGEYVTPGQKLFELVSLNPVEVEFHLAEVDSSRVSVGQSVDVRVAPYPDEGFAATVSVVSPTIDERTRTLRVKALLENSDGRLRPGLFARVDLGVSIQSDVSMILEEAVLQRSDGAVVFLVDDENRARRLVIQTGAHHDGTVEVVSGLEVGQRIVARGHATLVEGQLVAPRNIDGSPIEAVSPAVAGGPQ